MLNNDILRSVRFILNIGDAKMLAILQHAEPYADDDFTALLKKDDEAGFQPCSDELLSAFLDGLIIEKRGRRDDAPPPAPLLRLNNNDILKKLRVAFELKQEDIEALIALTGLQVSSAEVGALFRKPGHKNFRLCGDQFLRYLLKGLSIKLRPGAQPKGN
ncbi:DUF1456 family protein [Vogesella oryzae]|uniref:DUF1456 family protein n=1 Tax=Vogesella oryzae TaxID=1735285 RepID=UPI001583A5EE|nr:DUF1456 family protein [Vogesella oryzae]